MAWPSSGSRRRESPCEEGCTSRFGLTTAKASTGSTPRRSKQAQPTTVRPGSARSTTRTTTARTSSTPTATTSRQSATAPSSTRWSGPRYRFRLRAAATRDAVGVSLRANTSGEGRELEALSGDERMPAGLAFQLISEVGVRNGDHRSGPLRNGFALEVHDPMLGDHVHHVGSSAGDDVAGGQVDDDAARAHAVTLIGRGHADERLPADRGVRAAHELRLPARAADVAVAGGLAGCLALQVHLRGAVDRHDAFVLHDGVRLVGQVDGVAQEVGVAVGGLVLHLRPDPEGAHDLAGVERLLGAGDDAGAVEIDDAVGEHLGVDAQLTHAALAQQRADGVRHRSDADLQAAAVLDLGGDQLRDGAVGIAGRQVWDLRKGPVVARDHVVDLALVHRVSDTVEARQRG